MNDKPARPPRKPFVRDYTLPGWVHRIANATVLAMVAALPVTLLIVIWPSQYVWLLVPVVFLAGLVTDPKKIPFLEGTGDCNPDREIELPKFRFLKRKR